MKHVQSVAAIAAATCLAVPALAQTVTPGSDGVGKVFTANASGALELPPNASPGAAMVTLTVNGTSMTVEMPFSMLTSSSIAAHIHCCTTSAFTGTAPVALPFTDFPTGVTSGTYTHTFDLGSSTTFSPAFLKSSGGGAPEATTALMNGIAANEAYVNIHSTEFPYGEIRGWLVAAPVPEPGEWAMLGIGVGGLLWTGRRRRMDL